MYMLDAIKICDGASSFCITNQEYTSLSDFQKVIHIMQQSILCDYVRAFTLPPNFTLPEVKCNGILDNYKNALKSKLDKLPYSQYMPGKYQQAYEVTAAMFDNFTGVRSLTISATDIVCLLGDQEIADNEALNSFKKEFYLPFLYAAYGTKIDSDYIADRDTVSSLDSGYELLNPIIYKPEFAFEENDKDEYSFSARRNNSVNEENARFIMRMIPLTAFASFSIDDYENMEKHFSIANRLIAGLNWRGKTSTALIAIMALFSIEHDHYAMHYHMQDLNRCSVSDICYDIITCSNYTADIGCSSTSKVGFEKLLKYLCDRWNLAIDDYVLFGDLLQRLGYSADTVSYLQKDITQVTTAEMESFKRSSLASFINKGMEATDLPTDELGDVNTDTSGALGGTTTEPDGMSPESTDTPIDGPAEEEDPNNAVIQEIKRTIPEASDGILIELLDPEKETLSDYLYRAEFQLRVRNIMQNPSSVKCSKRVLHLLEQWATKWLYVCSVASLKSFLKNVSFPLMANEQ